MNQSQSDADVDVQTAGRTDTGKRRSHNEDAFAVRCDLGLYVVADGMGGAQAGEVAASMVTQVLPLHVAAHPHAYYGAAEAMAKWLGTTLNGLSHKVHEQSQQVDHLRGMGATVVACLIRSGTAALSHMGDSRAYMLRAGALERLTEDHTLAEILLKLGHISKADARKHPGRQVVTRYVGMEGEALPDVGLLELERDDVLLLCSDGLTNMVSDRAIGEMLLGEPDLAMACEHLIEAANGAGGEDNITALLIRYGEAHEIGKGDKKVTVRRAVGRSIRPLAWEPPGIDDPQTHEQQGPAE